MGASILKLWSSTQTSANGLKDVKLLSNQIKSLECFGGNFLQRALLSDWASDLNRTVWEFKACSSSSKKYQGRSLLSLILMYSNLLLWVGWILIVPSWYKLRKARSRPDLSIWDCAQLRFVCVRLITGNISDKIFEYRPFGSRLDSK